MALVSRVPYIHPDFVGDFWMTAKMLALHPYFERGVFRGFASMIV